MNVQQKSAADLAIGRSTDVEARWDARLRDAFLGMTVGLKTRPHPRYQFDRVAAADHAQRGRAPWQPLVEAMRSVQLAGGSKDQVVAFAEELFGYALSLFPTRDEPGLTATLIAESDADAEADPVQTRAIAHADDATLDRLIFTSQVQIDRLRQVINAARARRTQGPRRFELVR